MKVALDWDIACHSFREAIVTRRGGYAGRVATRTQSRESIGVIIAMNFLASALWTVGVLASIYAGVLKPEFRVTASSLSSIINDHHDVYPGRPSSFRND